MADTKPSHDAALCDCQVSGECTCQCERCSKQREKVYRFHRLAELQARLEKAGIDITDLAELLFMARWNTLEKKVELYVDQAVKRTFREAFKEPKKEKP